MRALVLAAAMLSSILISNGAAAQADQPVRSATAVPAGAPIVQVQPRAEDFSPKSPANEAEQERLSRFDVKQEKRDEALDKKLDI
jgi:hypothetical protein